MLWQNWKNTKGLKLKSTRGFSQLSVNKLGDTAEVFTHEFTCQNFVQSDTRLVLERDQIKSVTKLKAMFFKGLCRKANNLEIQDLYWKNSIGCL